MNWRRLLGRQRHQPDDMDPAIEEAQEQVDDLKRRAEVVAARLRRVDPWGTPLARIARRER